MKARKEYLILAAVIITAWSYLILHKDDRTQYELPNIPKIDITAVTALEITARGKTIALNKQGEEWLIAPQNYPADGAKIKSMLFEIEDIAVTDLVSESKAYARYQLDDQNKISIKVWEKDILQRELDIGKEAATYQHTFIRLPGNPSVYHARGDFRRKFDKSDSDLRDREVLAFDPGTLKNIRVTVDSDTLEMTRRESSMEDKPEPVKEGDTPAESPKTVWLSTDGRQVDEKAMERFLSGINNLMCESYLEGRKRDEFENPVFEIALEGKQAYSLSIFKNTAAKDDSVPAISSYNDFPFTLSGSRLESMKKEVARLFGKKAAAAEK